jgi:hypothetical protein
MSVLEPGDEPTENDLRRMTMIHKELEEFLKEFKLRHSETEGSACLQKGNNKIKNIINHHSPPQPSS